MWRLGSNKLFRVRMWMLAALFMAACVPFKPPAAPTAPTTEKHPMAAKDTGEPVSPPVVTERGLEPIAKKPAPQTEPVADESVVVKADTPENAAAPKTVISKPVAAPTQGPDPAGLPPKRITAMEVLETGKGARVSLKGNGSLQYNLFPLMDPPRLLLVFPATTLGPAVQPRTLDRSTIVGLFPRERKDGSGNLEIILREMLDYDVQERPDGLNITVFANKRKAGSRAGIKNVRATQDESGTHIHLLGTGVIPRPQTYRINNPPRLVMDLFGVEGPVKPLNMAISSPEAAKMELVDGPQKTRLIVDLADPTVAFRVGRDGGMPVIHLTHQTVTTRADGRPSTPAIQTVDFTRDGEDGVVRIRVNKPGIVLDTRRQDQNLLLTLKNTSIPSELSRRLDVRAFGGPVSTIDSYADGTNSRIVVSLSDPADIHDILQKEHEIFVRVQSKENAARAEESKETVKPLYSGDKISMDFKDIDIKNALRLIAEISELNIILSDSVTGTLTMRLVEVPWDQALDLMLDSQGLGKVVQGNVMRIAPMADIQRLNEARIQAQQSSRQLEAIITEMIPISFATAAEIRDLILDRNSQSATGAPAQGAGTGTTPAGTGGARGNQQQGRSSNLLSEVGSVSIDPRTNTLIVKDMASNIAKIREMVTLLDRPIPQVLIEARIVTVDRNSSFALGINWGLNFKDRLNSPLGISSTMNSAYTVQQDVTTRGERRPIMSASPVMVNLKPAGTVGNVGMHLGSISPIIDVGIEIGALEDGGKAKTISSPRVITVNGHKASISQGVTVYFPAESESGGTTLEPQQAQLVLEVTPQVSPNGFITMEVDVTNDALASTGGTASGVPAINNKNISTKAMIKDGETLVLGGVFQDLITDSQGGVPKFKEIPLLGWLFKNKQSSNTQSELLIFITPRIVGPT